MGSQYCRPTVQAPQKLNFGTFYTANGEILSSTLSISEERKILVPQRLDYQKDGIFGSPGEQ
jgi:hypothetical protein